MTLASSWFAVEGAQQHRPLSETPDKDKQDNMEHGNMAFTLGTMGPPDFPSQDGLEGHGDAGARSSPGLSGQC